MSPTDIATGEEGYWVMGEMGATCDQTCNENEKCDATAMKLLHTNDLVEDAFLEAGYVCKGFHGPREYPGTPFSTGRDDDDCAPFIPDSLDDATCSRNNHAHHSPLCRCVPPPSEPSASNFWEHTQRLSQCHLNDKLSLSEAQQMCMSHSSCTGVAENGVHADSLSQQYTTCTGTTTHGQVGHKGFVFVRSASTPPPPPPPAPAPAPAPPPAPLSLPLPPRGIMYSQALRTLVSEYGFDLPDIHESYFLHTAQSHRLSCRVFFPFRPETGQV